MRIKLQISEDLAGRVRREVIRGLRCRDCGVPFANDERAPRESTLCVSCYNLRAVGRLECQNHIALTGHYVTIAPAIISKRLDYTDERLGNCRDCGEPIRAVSIYCQSCASLHRWQKRRKAAKRKT